LFRVCLVALGFLLPFFAGASESRVSAADAAEIRAVINRQIDAFRRDDARGAFALVSPAVQQTFGTPERFLDAVRASYRAVYRPAIVSFRELLVMDGEVLQQLQVIDGDGRVWIAFYAMQRQRDGSWRTNGCHLVPPTRSISA
jgi:hypothetical protein